jgi:hypothetical protein
MKKFIIVILLLNSFIFAQENNQTQFSLSTKGFITSWLIKGPFSSGGGILREKDFLVSEGSELNKFSIAAVSDGVSAIRNFVDRGKWFPIYSDKYIISFLNYFQVVSNTVGYALAFVESDKDRDVIIKLGSDDGVKLFLNGKLIHDNPMYRGVIIDEDVVSAQLNKGLNPLLVKIDQGTGDWGFCLRIVGPDDEELRDVKVRIPFKFSSEELSNSMFASFNLKTTLDKTTNNTRLLIVLSAENGFPMNLDAAFKLKISLLSSSSEAIQEINNTEFNSISQFSEKEIIFIPKNLEAGQYVIKLFVLDKNNRELMTKESIVFWN